MLERSRNRLLWSALALAPLSLAATPDPVRLDRSLADEGGRTWDAGPADAPCCSVVELRRYTLHPGRRDTLIDLFDRHFVEEQEATGMRIVAQFRDLDRPDVFTWVRGFPDMASRAASLGAFYGGPVWAAHRDAANATMIDSDNVLLLRPVSPGSGFVLGGRAPAGATAIPPGLVVATVYTLAPPHADGFAGFFERTVAPRLAASGARPVAVFETEPSPNTFPRLPVREGERAFVWFARFADAAEYERHARTLARDRRWTAGVLPALGRRLASPAEVLRLAPTARSRTIR
jgi:quinol monooxygenase YgiN